MYYKTSQRLIRRLGWGGGTTPRHKNHTRQDQDRDYHRDNQDNHDNTRAQKSHKTVVRNQMVPHGPSFSHLIATCSPTQLRLTHKQSKTISQLANPPGSNFRVHSKLYVKPFTCCLDTCVYTSMRPLWGEESTIALRPIEVADFNLILQVENTCHLLLCQCLFMVACLHAVFY